MSKEEAQRQYIEIVKELDPTFMATEQSPQLSIDKKKNNNVMSPTEIAKMWEYVQIESRKGHTHSINIRSL
jgi:hypothetical protein